MDVRPVVVVAYEGWRASVAASSACDSGLQLRAQARVEDHHESIDTLVISGGVCTGATILAAAGLLDGRSATTHWMYARGLAQRYPKVAVDAGPIFIRNGCVSTSGGVTAALDLTLAFIEEDHGSAAMQAAPAARPRIP